MLISQWSFHCNQNYLKSPRNLILIVIQIRIRRIILIRLQFLKRKKKRNTTDKNRKSNKVQNLWMKILRKEAANQLRKEKAWRCKLLRNRNQRIRKRMRRKLKKLLVQQKIQIRIKRLMKGMMYHGSNFQEIYLIYKIRCARIQDGSVFT